MRDLHPLVEWSIEVCQEYRAIDPLRWREEAEAKLRAEAARESP